MTPRIRRAVPAETDAVRRLLTTALLEPPPSLVDAVAAGQVHVAVGGRDGTDDSGPARVVGCLVRLTPAETPDTEQVASCVESLDPAQRPFDPTAWRTQTTATHVDSLAVARGRRGDGVGTALVESAAAAATDTPADTAPTATVTPCPLTAAFRPAVRPFYESLDFTVVPTSDDDRLVGWGAPTDE